MFGIGGSELVVIVLVALLILGPQRIPEVARALTRAWREWTKVKGQVDETIHDLRQEINIKARLHDELAPVLREAEGAAGQLRGGVDDILVDPPAAAAALLPVPEHDDYLAQGGTGRGGA